MKILQIGMDAEYFAQDAQGTFVPVCGLIGGTKEEPIKSRSGYGTLQEDNVMGEIGCLPARTREEFRNHVTRTVADLREKYTSLGLFMSYDATAQFDANCLTTRQARMFGCDRDWNAWTKRRNPLVRPSQAGTLRTTGGHIHLSLSDCTKDEKLMFVRYLDHKLGLFSVLNDKEKVRRNLYGKAGSFRLTEYPDGTSGIEYRVLSNFWTFEPALINKIYDLVFEALDMFHDFDGNGDIWRYDIRSIIDTYDVRGAEHVYFDPFYGRRAA